MGLRVGSAILARESSGQQKQRRGGITAWRTRLIQRAWIRAEDGVTGECHGPVATGCEQLYMDRSGAGRVRHCPPTSGSLNVRPGDRVASQAARRPRARVA